MKHYRVWSSGGVLCGAPDLRVYIYFLGRKVSKRWSNLAFFNTLQSFVLVQNIEEVFIF